MTRLVLASGSVPRRAMLTAAGLTVEIFPPDLDEAAIKSTMKGEGASPEAVAMRLATEKAARISGTQPSALVIGADQMLECEGVSFDKPENLDMARAQLRFLRGRRHRLHSAVALVRDGNPVAGFVESASLTMRDFSDEFLEAYLRRAGTAILGSVGAYQLEGPGIQLFSAIEGDFFAILGLPLLKLLTVLRDMDVIAK